jgi:Ser/Thr protein kinase RdoA (MazF antagonist)
VTTPTDALADARARIAARPAVGRIARHLAAHHGIAVAGLSELDLGVFRVDRTVGPAWIARVFPAARPESAAAGDAEILRFVAGHDFESERVVTQQPVSVLDGQPVLVTGFVSGAPRSQRAAVLRDLGGLRRLGELLGRLHALPAADGAVARPGGAWHHLADGRPQDELRTARALLDCRGATVTAAERPHYDLLARELAAADDGEGLPESLIHPDFVFANVIASPERGMVLVDWSGAGRGPRAWPLAFLLYAEAAKNPPRARLVLEGYRRQVRLEPAEIARLPALMPVRAAVLATWSFCLDRVPAERAAATAASARALAESVGPLVTAYLQSEPASGQ